MNKNVVKPLVKIAQGSKPPTQAQKLVTKTTVPMPSATKPSLSSKSQNNITKVGDTKKPTLISSVKKNDIDSTKLAKEEKKENVPQKSVFIGIELSKTREMVKKLKEIEDIQKINTEEINLNLNTSFQSDSDMSNFTFAFSKIANKIRNLNWIIKGQWKDQGSGRCIGELITKCTNLYSLKLNISSSFGDHSASALAQALKKLNNLRILRIYIEIKNLGKQSIFSENSNNKLNESINTLKKLEILEYNCYDILDEEKQDNLSNHLYVISENYEDPISDLIKTDFLEKEFQTKMLSVQNKITELNIVNEFPSFPQFQYYEFYSPITYPRFCKVYNKLLPYVANLPYLTSLRKTFVQRDDDDEDEYDDDYEEEVLFKTNKLEITVQNLIKSKLVQILQITLLKNKCLDQIPLNPNFLIADLYLA